MVRWIGGHSVWVGFVRIIQLDPHVVVIVIIPVQVVKQLVYVFETMVLGPIQDTRTRKYVLNRHGTGGPYLLESSRCDEPLECAAWTLFDIASGPFHASC